MSHDKEAFIDKWRTALGCRHDYCSEELCWCVYCQALEKIWFKEEAVRQTDSLEAINKIAKKYLDIVYHYDLGKIGVIPAEELLKLAEFFYPDGRFPGIFDLYAYSDEKIRDEKDREKELFVRKEFGPAGIHRDYGHGKKMPVI